MSTDPPLGSTFLAQAARLAGVVGSETDPHAIWHRADAVFDAAIWHRLFTVLVHHAEQGAVVRAYSSQPKAYPVQGSKPIGATPWGERVPRQGRPFVGRDAAALRWAFPDHPAILGMGLGSAINLPVRLAGRTLGTINLLHQAGHHNEDQVEAGLILAGLLVPVMAGLVP